MAQPGPFYVPAHAPPMAWQPGMVPQPAMLQMAPAAPAYAFPAPPAVATVPPPQVAPAVVAAAANAAAADAAQALSSLPPDTPPAAREQHYHQHYYQSYYARVSAAPSAPPVPIAFQGVPMPHASAMGMPLQIPQEQAAKPTATVDPATATQLLVSPISDDVTPSAMSQLFAEHGTVDLVRIIKDKPTGQRRGYGFVYYHTPEDAQRGMAAINGSEFFGKTLRVSVAVPQKPLSRRGLTSIVFLRRRQEAAAAAAAEGKALSDHISSGSSDVGSVTTA